MAEKSQKKKGEKISEKINVKKYLKKIIKISDIYQIFQANIYSLIMYIRMQRG